MGEFSDALMVANVYQQACVNAKWVMLVLLVPNVSDFINVQMTRNQLVSIYLLKTKDAT